MKRAIDEGLVKREDLCEYHSHLAATLWDLI